MKYRILAGAAGVALCASAATAQVCQGDLSFRGTTHVSGALAMSNNSTTFGGGASWGHARGLYGGGSLGLASYDGFSGNGFVLGGGIGYAMPVANRSAWQLCPGATLSLGFGPSQDLGGGNTLHTSTQTFTLGASVGRAMPLNRQITLLPFGSVALGHTTMRASSAGVSGSSSDTYLDIGFGAGFQLSPSVVLRPALNLMAGADLVDDTVFSFAVSFALPR